jgi:truncated hemoglobin YjbI
MSKSEEFEKMGGRQSLERISKVFYDKIYDHPWLKLYFEKLPQEYIESQQCDFMEQVLGGNNQYAGKTPPKAHRHILVSEELFELRQELLKESFRELHVHPELGRKWLQLDQTFKPQIVKTTLSDCQQRYDGEGILAFSNPA